MSRCLRGTPGSMRPCACRLSHESAPVRGWWFSYVVPKIVYLSPETGFLGVDPDTCRTNALFLFGLAKTLHTFFPLLGFSLFNDSAVMQTS